MSKQSEQVYKLLTEIFPLTYIEPEYYVNYKNIHLFFDFRIKSLGILIEVQGIQHNTFSRHLHNNDIENFRAQKRRDNLKLMYLEEHPELVLTFFYYNDKITKELVLQRITEAQEASKCPKF